MDNPLTEIDKKLMVIKEMFERAIIEDGREKAISLIRSQKLIGVIHEYIKEELIAKGISPNKIYPKLGHSNGEIAMTGFLKKKKQDVSVIAEDFTKEKIVDGVLIGKYDNIGKENMDKSLSINIRSQLSSLGKNFDTLYERTFAEALNLHLRAPKLVMGEVYMISLIGYDPTKMKSKEVAWKEKLPLKYIPAFRELNKRESDKVNEYKYERLCLLIVDFSKKQPKIISSAEELFNLGLIKKEDIETYSLKGMGIEDFVKDLLGIYEKRHGSLAKLKS